MKQDILNFSPNEKKVFESLRKRINTPLLIAQATAIPRPTVYVTLDDLKFRGLVETHLVNGKKFWRLKTEQEIDEELYVAKRFLFNLPEGRKEIRSAGDSFVVIHRGKEAIHKLLQHVFKEHKNEKMYGLQGNTSTSAWEAVLPIPILNEINDSIKKNHILMHAVLEKGWAIETAKKFGIEWARNFEGRTTSVHELSPEYMNYPTEIWLFKNSVYMFAPKEEIVVEIKNSDMVHMIKALFNFIQDHTRSIDINHVLREVLEK